MAVIYNDAYDISDLPDLDLDDYTTGLCIPQDPIEELEWFPSFSSDLISLNDLRLTPEHEPLALIDFEASEKQVKELSPTTPEQNVEKPEDKKPISKPGMENFNGYGGFSKRGLGKFNGYRAFPRKKQRSRRVLKQRRHRGWSSMELAESDDGVFRVEKRRCSHCQTDKTPQWRIGPLGPKTLCNACGVRYRSGRLVAEYRPACSPTFNSLQHSNFHKKILKRKGILA
ncbi:hypothetical protein JCGZ_15342 [Jatropha curcas]|uniref:GATA-type domain-containing protein n=1 Tax=Jatropha curcas TaxID=180498 RepID=A0A067K5Q9_JATCU|nr:GATA transcription factor 9 [Jatropha curcas]KDP31462.1 hypothetical protein JCGZ_15342 [Jatropha curcas]